MKNEISIFARSNLPISNDNAVKIYVFKIPSSYCMPTVITVMQLGYDRKSFQL